MKYEWVAIHNGEIVARGATVEEARALASLAGYDEVEVSCEWKLPEE